MLTLNIPLPTPRCHIHRKTQLYKTKYTPAVTRYVATLQHYVGQDYKRHTHTATQYTHFAGPFCTSQPPCSCTVHAFMRRRRCPQETCRLPSADCHGTLTAQQLHVAHHSTFRCAADSYENRSHSTEYVQICHTVQMSYRIATQSVKKYGNCE